MRDSYSLSRRFIADATESQGLRLQAGEVAEFAARKRAVPYWAINCLLAIAAGVCLMLAAR